jgi:hypothetical protein
VAEDNGRKGGIGILWQMELPHDLESIYFKGQIYHFSVIKFSGNIGRCQPTPTMIARNESGD